MLANSNYSRFGNYFMSLFRLVLLYSKVSDKDLRFQQ